MNLSEAIGQIKKGDTVWVKAEIRRVGDYEDSHEIRVVMGEKMDWLDEYTEISFTEPTAIDSLAQEYDAEPDTIREWLDRGHAGSFETVVVPEFVAEKMKYYKSALQMLSSEYFDSSSEIDSDELANWIDQNSEKFFRAWLDGYEVEKKPRWVVKSTNFGIYFASFRSDYLSGIFGLKKHAHVFTDRAKAAAVAVLVNGTVEKI